MTVTINGTSGITTPGLNNSGPLSGTTGTFSGIISANGGGITFPATQSASSDANTLDDYEEGTFTPSYEATGGGMSITTYQIRAAQYTKIGRNVTVVIHISTNTVASVGTGYILITGLPFTASSSVSLTSCGYSAYASNGSMKSGYVNTGDTKINVTGPTSTSALSSNLETPTANFSGTGAFNNYMALAFTYMTN